MDKQKALNPKRTNRLQLLLKIIVSAACLWYVFTKIDLSAAIAGIRKANLFLLLLALAVYTLSKYIGARRLAVNFSNIGIHLPEIQNVKLYWLGMFYNLFLPGAITGDAYKVVILSKRFKAPYKMTTAAVILDRFSGLLSLGLLVAIYSCFAVRSTWLIALLITGAVAAIPVLYWVIRKFFPAFLPGFWSTFVLGALVQLTILLCVYIILWALGIQEEITILVFVFLIAIVISVLPISIGGGLGVREFAIIEGAKIAGLETTGQQHALILSLLFYLITVICSLAGIAFVINDPFRKAEK